MMEEAVRYLHSPEAMTNMEVFITYALSRLTETGLAPTFPLFYGAWRTTLREWTKDLTDCDELEDIEEYIDLQRKEDDDGSFDIDLYKREPLKTCYRLFEYNDGDIWCSVNNFPVYLLATEKMENDLFNLVKETTITNGELHSMWWQVVYGIMSYQKLGITHNDLHVSNIMFKATDKRWLYYRLGDKIIEVPTFGRLWRIIDYGRATYDGEGLSIGNNMAFGATGECYNVLFSARPNGLGRRPNNPHIGVDTMTLAMNILMDVFGAPNCELTESARAYFENIISDDNGSRVCYLDSEITFEDHIRIVNAKPLEKTTPLNILKGLSGMYREVRLEELDDGEILWGGLVNAGH
jgi:serine/threonine protein kinase